MSDGRARIASGWPRHNLTFGGCPASEDRVNEDWSPAEVEATVSDYFAMFTKELRGEPLNKADHNRQLLALLPCRSRGAIEFKHANISAVLIELGHPYVDGYKPRSNYQDLLRKIVADRIAANTSLQIATHMAVEQPVRSAPAPGDLAEIIVPAPMRETGRNAWRESRQPEHRPRQPINYLEREARNTSLGLAGEQFILRVEHARLWDAGERRLADRVEHVAKTQGDGLGYDIMSYDADGRERLIEVKTTRYGAMTPFFATRNEVAVSDERAAQYHVYRVFKFDAAPPKVFMLPGSLRQSCNLDPVQYQASVR